VSTRHNLVRMQSSRGRLSFGFVSGDKFSCPAEVLQVYEKLTFHRVINL